MLVCWPPWPRPGSVAPVASRFGGPVAKGRSHGDKTEGRGRKDDCSGLGVLLGSSPNKASSRKQGRPGLFPASQPISFFRKASSWSSSLMPTNLSTTSPFLMASTVGTADTWVREPETRSLGGECVPRTLPKPLERRPTLQVVPVKEMGLRWVQGLEVHSLERLPLPAPRSTLLRDEVKITSTRAVRQAAF